MALNLINASDISITNLTSYSWGMTLIDNELYIGEYSSKVVQVYSLQGQFKRTFNIPSGSSLFLATDGTDLYIYEASSFKKINKTNGAVISTESFGGSVASSSASLYIDRDLGLIYSPNYTFNENNFQILKYPSGEVVKNYSLGNLVNGRPSGVTVIRDGNLKYLLVNVYTENIIMISSPFKSIEELENLSFTQVGSNTDATPSLSYIGCAYSSETKELFISTYNRTQIRKYGVSGFIKDKTLILHDGEYKKCSPTISYIDGENLIPILTSNVSIYGEAFGSSLASSGGANYYKAFSRVIGDTWTSANVSFPHYIGFGFNSKVKVSSYKLISRSYNENDLLVMVRDWTFEGSNDKSNWTVLDTQSNQIWTEKLQAREFVLANQVEYQYYRIRVTANNGFTNSQVSIDGMELYNNIIRSDKWSTVSNTLPTPAQFLSDGMDSLSPLLDRRVETLTPLPMSIVNGILQTGEEGKVFSKTLDLKKYMDIRKIKVEVR